VTTLPVEILRSIHYRADNGLPMPAALKTRAFKAVESLAPINAEYHDRITEALLEYFGGSNIQTAKGQFKRAAANAFLDAFDLGWAMGGGEFPVDDDAGDWLGARQTAEFGFIDELFLGAKELKKEDGFDVFPWVSERADRYTATLAAIFNAGKMWSKKNQLLTWRLGNTEKNCSTCAKLDGQRHRASWYISRDYIPRKPGAAMICGGYNCDCKLEDKDGNEVTA